ncbi:uncharacterized protein Tco025E_05105 [Trypanosoma conorhini]|uniref:Uncharacterized protein n=1 Tax=Trypanosoma conorhini TaxID=83891 RepID=A0A422PFY7_9TRYP|nr:uncharacterized protein Tco025E_05105 [Trypanosoma conorhini]RNF16626.1 hypothetical protein Tco025E_05105 [Trypanosoma conorhini]
MMSRRGCSYFLPLIERGVVVRRNGLGVFEVSSPSVENFYIDATESMEFAIPVEAALGCRVEPPLGPVQHKRSHLQRGLGGARPTAVPAHICCRGSCAAARVCRRHGGIWEAYRHVLAVGCAFGCSGC